MENNTHNQHRHTMPYTVHQLIIYMNVLLLLLLHNIFSALYSQLNML